MHTWIKRWVAGAFIGGVLLAPSIGVALEPDNNDIPWNTTEFKQDMTSYIRSTGAYITMWSSEAIDTSGDIDHLLLTCRGNVPRVAGVGIEMATGSGDLDIKAYDLNGNYLGGSAGTTKWEDIVIGGSHRSVVLKVYGYNSAVGEYGARLNCD